MEYDLERWCDTRGAWHFRLVQREQPARHEDDHFEARLGYLRFLIGRGLVRLEGEQASGAY